MAARGYDHVNISLHEVSEHAFQHRVVNHSDELLKVQVARVVAVGYLHDAHHHALRDVVLILARVDDSAQLVEGDVASSIAVVLKSTINYFFKSHLSIAKMNHELLNLIEHKTIVR